MLTSKRGSTLRPGNATSRYNLSICCVISLGDRVQCVQRIQSASEPDEYKAIKCMCIHNLALVALSLTDYLGVIKYCDEVKSLGMMQTKY